MKNKKHKHWSNSQNGIKSYVKSLENEKFARKKERLRLKEIKDFKVDDIVVLKELSNTKKEYIEKVLKVYDKSYKISFGFNDYVLIKKESLSGFPNSIVKSRTGDSRRFVNTKLKLIK